MLILRMCLSSCENGVSTNVSTTISARPGPITRAPRQRIFASLWERVASAENASPTTAARMPLTLLAAILIPMPVPQTRTPLSASFAATQSATAKAKSGVPFVFPLFLNMIYSSSANSFLTRLSSRPLTISITVLYSSTVPPKGSFRSPLLPRNSFSVNTLAAEVNCS